MDAETLDRDATAGVSGAWRCVWYVPEAITGWRSQLDHLQGNEYLGTNPWPTQAEAEARGKRDQEKFDDIGIPPGVIFLRAQFFPSA